MLDPKEETKETDILPETPAAPENPTPPEPSASAEARARELELENARLQGEIEARRSMPAPAAAAPDKEEAWKQTVWADIANLPEDQFLTKYNVPKGQASSEMLKRELAASTEKTQVQVAELQAENRLMAKYPDYAARQDSIREVLADLSPEVRRDPVKLGKALERAYQADKTAHPEAKPKAPVASGGRRVVDSSFAPPARSAGDAPPPKNDKDEIPAEHRAVCKAFGITSEKERQELMKNDFVPMNLGGGVVFRDPEKGFEKVA